MSNKQTMDGNTAAAYVSYAFTDVAAIYPITPSSPMAEYADQWAASGKKNIFGQTVDVVELQSEGGAAGAVHGSLAAGALTTTFTASQGLLLMIPNMYKIAGELLPCVFHVSARALASHALSIFGDHSDVMAARQTGFAFLASGSVQEVMDLGGVAHLASIKTRVPFVHFFDGFRTSHEIQKIETIDYAEFDRLVDKDAIKAFKSRALNPEHPVTRGTAQNPDIFFQAREASNPYYTNLADTVNDYMGEISKITGREYKPFVYYGAEDAENIIVAMGSVTDTIDETIDYMLAKGEKVGVIKVHLYRPFSEKYFFDVLPSTVKKIAVLDRTKEPGAVGEPLYTDIKALFYDKEVRPVIVGGRYGLGSKDTTPSNIYSVYKNLEQDAPKNNFTISIKDDVTNLSLEDTVEVMSAPEGTIACKFWGLGSDGTVGANKSAIKIIGDKTDLFAQGYFAYDSKKSGGITISHLRFGSKPIKSTYLIAYPDFISCSNEAYVHQYDLLKGIKKGGTFLLNTTWDKEALKENLPNSLVKQMIDNDIKFYTIDATNIAQSIGLGNRTNMIMQTAFFKLSAVINIDDAVKYLKEAIVKSYGRKGEKIVNMNYQAVDGAIDNLVKIDLDDSFITDSEVVEVATDKPAFITEILEPINRQEGDNLPVSTFVGREDGAFPQGTAAYEKRGVAAFVPEWISDNCIQCNQCSFVCPHAAIRPILINQEEADKKPEAFNTIKATGKQFDGLQYRIQVDTLDCTGCGNCANVCPAKEKALVMKPIGTQRAEEENWTFAMKEVSVKNNIVPATTVKGSQFKQPLFEFSGACAGCGETPYMKVITQLFGDRMIIANATGCSSIWGGSAPSTPYCVNDQGRGPAWANSLFEDNAEYGFGMAVAVKKTRKQLLALTKALAEKEIDSTLVDAINAWFELKDDSEKTIEVSGALINALEGATSSDEEVKALIADILENKDYLAKKSVWIVGGDGWAFDIGYGGLDHVLASGENVNVLVLDTEIYSNTGGQASKSTPTGAVAKFAASGKKVKKKDLGMIAATYGYVYVAQVAMGSDKNQFMKAIIEAEKYDGPSLIIAYAPCISHGIKGGMGNSQEQQNKAVKAGYFSLYRYNPENEGNEFTLDSKAPTESFQDFIHSEVRYTSLEKSFPEEAKVLFAKAEKEAKARVDKYTKMSDK
jgi:pyruvate-ferredoxin/flavodoxin oxidoreductase